MLEQRHAEQVKQLGLQLVSEREQLTATTLRLEKKLADVQEEEIRLRSELAALQSVRNFFISNEIFQSYLNINSICCALS